MNSFLLIATFLLFTGVRAGPFSKDQGEASPVILTPDNQFHQLYSRDVNISDCRISIPTDVWTTCQSFITAYNITLANFAILNPSVYYDCSGFVSGTSYCVENPATFPVSTDGVCGHQAPTNATCVGSTFGDCCSASGTCGSTDAFCAIGNCQEGDCPGLGYSTDGFCGPAANYGGYYCGGNFGTCCSNAGVCGSTTAECGSSNCYSGDCEGATSAAASSTASATPLPSPFSPSPDGTCGYTNQYTCLGTQYYFGYCCGSAGYCGTTQYECDNLEGCQSAYGLCDETVVITVIGTGGVAADSTSAVAQTTKPVSSPTTSLVEPTTSTSSSSTTSSEASATSIAGSVCVGGTGTENYLGLCNYCCGYGYCPPGPCSCTTYGQQVPTPAATWPPGYAVSGEDSSYDGLCSFACNHGYCPPTACTY